MGPLKYRTVVRSFLAAVLILFIGRLHATDCRAQLFRWTDSNGVIHYSDSPGSHDLVPSRSARKMDEYVREEPDEGPEQVTAANADLPSGYEMSEKTKALVKQDELLRRELEFIEKRLWRKTYQYNRKVKQHPKFSAFDHAEISPDALEPLPEAAFNRDGDYSNGIVEWQYTKTCKRFIARKRNEKKRLLSVEEQVERRIEAFNHYLETKDRSMSPSHAAVLRDRWVKEHSSQSMSRDEGVQKYDPTQSRVVNDAAYGSIVAREKRKRKKDQGMVGPNEY